MQRSKAVAALLGSLAQRGAVQVLPCLASDWEGGGQDLGEWRTPTVDRDWDGRRGHVDKSLSDPDAPQYGLAGEFFP